MNIYSVSICECGTVTVQFKDDTPTRMLSVEKFEEEFFLLDKSVGCNHCYGNNFTREEK